ncbi:MAG TPA: DUF2155 domain-containing protein [Candidatus Deferrimicrobium sp.]|nr:DUF2155 domain-containing protein [Candidatus Deferrimicrobium sp.]
MKKFTLLVAVLMMVAFAGAGCKKKEPPKPPMPPQSTPGAPGMPGMPGAPHGETGAPAVEKKIVVPDAVKGAWKAVKVEVEFKEKKSKKAFTVPLNSEFKVPDSDLTLKVGNFLPHFVMAADQITSGSNNTENPAAQIEVFQGGKEIFHGWLFAKYPAVHPLTHDKYGVTLLEGVKK